MKKDSYPIIGSIKECTGCAACEYACSNSAVTMTIDNQGFLYPKIDMKKCVGCKLCERVCKQKANGKQINNALAFQSKDEKAIKKSTSGGAIPEIVKSFLNHHGAVYATSYDRANGARWIWLNNVDKISEISGSKYFQIPLRKHDYSNIQKKIEEGHKVLFIGTPCQVSGVSKAISNKLKKDLYLVDIVCGGVASPLLEEKYIEFEEKREGIDIAFHSFRSKDNGWNREYTTTIISSDNIQMKKIGSEDYYTRAYTSGRYMRESCYKCEYASRYRVSDITVGDCWGIEKENSIDENVIRKGVSLVCCNTDKGEDLLRDVDKQGIIYENAIRFVENNKPLNSPSERPFLRSISYNLLKRLSFPTAINIVCYRRLIKKYILRRNVR